MTNIPEGCTEDDIFSLVAGAGVPLRSVAVEVPGQPSAAFLRLEPEDQKPKEAPQEPEEAPVAEAADLPAAAADPVAAEDGKEDTKMEDAAPDATAAAEAPKEGGEEEKKEVEEEKKEGGEEEEKKEGEAAEEGGSSSSTAKPTTEAKLAPTPPKPKVEEVTFKREEFFSEPDKVRPAPPSPSPYYVPSTALLASLAPFSPCGCRFVFPSVSICLSFRLCVCLSPSLSLSIYLYVCLSFSLSLSHSVPVSACLYVWLTPHV